MIHVSFSLAVTIYLLCSVVMVLLFWILVSKEVKLSSRFFLERIVWHCDICAFEYVDSSYEEYSLCPQCGSYNKKKEVVNDY